MTEGTAPLIDEKSFGRVVAEAARPRERESGGWFASRPLQDETRLAELERVWIKNVCGYDAGKFPGFLERRGVDGDEFRRWLEAGEVVDFNKIPAWARCIWDLLKTPPGETSSLGTVWLEEVSDPLALKILKLDKAAKAWPYQRVFQPFIDLATRWLAEKVATLPVRVAAKASRKLICDFLMQANLVCVKVLVEPSETGEGPVLETCFPKGRPVEEGWLALFEAYPGLCRCLGTLLINWRDAGFEMLDRFCADRFKLAETFGFHAGESAITDIDLGLGDRHRRGRSVCKLVLDGGVSVLYKPKDLRMVDWFMQWVAQLNALGLETPLHRRAVIADSDRYGWEEYVPNLPCKDEAAARRFFKRVGMYAKLLQLIEGKDFTADNLRTNGEHPVLVDLEMVFCPRLFHHPSSSQTQRLIKDLLSESPLESGILTVKVPGDAGRKALDLGILGQGSQTLVPFRLPTIQAFGQKDAHFKQDYLPLDAKNPLRYEDGTLVSPQSFFEAVLDGYREMGEFLITHRRTLIEDTAFIQKLAGLEVRFLYRDSRIYWRFLLESLEPKWLKDGVLREAFMEKLWKAFLVAPSAPKLIEDEIEAIYDGDIPLFLSSPDSDALVFVDGTIDQGYYCGTSLARFKKRLTDFDETGLADELRWVSSALFSVDANTLRPFVMAQGACLSANSSPCPIEWAVEIGDDILQKAHRLDNGGLTWVGLNYFPGNDYWELSKLGPSLLTGVAGLAVFFSELYRQTELKRFATATERCLVELENKLKPVTRTWDFPFMPSGRVTPRNESCGPFWGWGGYLFALAGGYTALGRTDRLQDLQEQISALPTHRLTHTAPIDWVSGLPGLFAVLVALRKTFPDHVPELAGQLGRALGELGKGEWPTPPYPEGATFLNHLPDQEHAMALAGFLGTDLPGETQPGAFASVSREPGEELLEDLPACPGNLLAKVTAFPDEFPAGALLSALDRHLELPPSKQSPSQWLVLAEIAMTAANHLQRGPFLDRCLQCLNRLRTVKQRHGCWLPDRYAHETHDLSVVSGLPAVGYLILRTHAPDLGSIRLLVDSLPRG